MIDYRCLVNSATGWYRTDTRLLFGQRTTNADQGNTDGRVGGGGYSLLLCSVLHTTPLALMTESVATRSR